MKTLKIYNDKCYSLFRLIGNDENALTFALGYIFQEREDILIDFLKEIEFLNKKKGKNYKNTFSNYSVHLQQYNDNKSGIKDIVIEDTKSKEFKIVLEAKTDNSVPSIEQIEKYSDNTINCDWSDYKSKVIVVLTRKILSDDIFKNVKEILGNNGIDLLIVSWSQVYKLIYKYRHLKSNIYCDRIVHELNMFLMEDYKIKYFEHEVLQRKVLKDYYTNICNLSDRGYYFDGGKTKFIYPSCLFFLACFGPAKNSKKTGEILRRIDKYYITSATEILNANDELLKAAFNKHLQKFGADNTNERIHVFELVEVIKVPQSKINFDGSEIGYKKLTDFLAE